MSIQKTFEFGRLIKFKVRRKPEEIQQFPRRFTGVDGKNMTFFVKGKVTDRGATLDNSPILLEGDEFNKAKLEVRGPLGIGKIRYSDTTSTISEMNENSKK
jgi:hypothetical protein